MLYDHKRWDKPVETDPLKLESLIAWLEKMPAKKAYDFYNCKGECLYGLYMASHGFSWVESGGAGERPSTQARSDFCDKVYLEVAAEEPYTFGAALSRARKALAEA